MSRVIHELMVKDRGLVTQRVSIRSNVPRPPDVGYNMCEMQYFETSLPPEESERFIKLMEYHHESLARAVGHAWIGEPD